MVRFMILPLLILLLFATVNSESFFEDVLITPLPRKHTALHFDFTFITPEAERSIQHFNTFPKSIYELIHKYDVREMQLSLTRGFWDHKKWGSPFMSTSSSSASLWAYFKGNSASVDDRYRGFADSLSGHFCASLKRIGNRKDTVSPIWSHSPWGLRRNPPPPGPKQIRERQDYLRYSQIPSEPVCTENLTPWLKLLPCRQRLGLASLLQPEVLMKSRYLSLGIQFRPICGDESCSTISLELKLFLTIVLDHLLVGLKTDQNFSLQSLMGSKITNSCPLADHEQVYLLLPSNKIVNPSSLAPIPTKTFTDNTSITIATFNVSTFLTSTGSLDITIPQIKQYVIPSPVSVTKFAVGGGGKETSGIQCIITNHDVNRHFRVIWLEHLPWFMRIQLHSLRIDLNVHTKPPIRTYFRPSRNRELSSHLELVLDLPPNSTLRVYYAFDKILQRWNEYPPDPHHGLYVPPSAVTFREKTDATANRLPSSANESTWSATLRQLPQNFPTYTDWFQHLYSASNAKPFGKIVGQDDNGFAMRLYTESVLVVFPTPDFSMPFNVLCMVCTLIIMTYMSVHRHCTNLVSYIPADQTNFLKKIFNW